MNFSEADSPLPFCLIKHRKGEKEKNRQALSLSEFSCNLTPSISRQIENNTETLLEDTFYKDASFPKHTELIALLNENSMGFYWWRYGLELFKNKNLEIILTEKCRSLAGYADLVVLKTLTL